MPLCVCVRGGGGGSGNSRGNETGFVSAEGIPLGLHYICKNSSAMKTKQTAEEIGRGFTTVQSFQKWFAE